MDRNIKMAVKEIKYAQTLAENGLERAKDLYLETRNNYWLISMNTWEERLKMSKDLRARVINNSISKEEFFEIVDRLKTELKRLKEKMD